MGVCRSLLRGKHSKMASITCFIMSNVVMCDILSDIALRRGMNLMPFGSFDTYPDFAVNGWAGSELKGKAPLLEKFLRGFFVGLSP